eukprot:3362913-Ditylum_brightwellii.AAC.1
MIFQTDDKPTYKTISKLKEKIYANVAAVPTTLGGGQHGHIGVVAPPTVYSTLSSKKYTALKEPMQPTFTVLTQDAMKVKNLMEYKEEPQIYNNHNIVNRVLKQQMKAAVDKKYLEELNEPLVGYMNITVQDMIDHLID